MEIFGYIGAVVGVLSAVSMLLHAFKLDENKYAKIFLSVSNDLVGAYKGYAASRAANTEAPSDKK